MQTFEQRIEKAVQQLKNADYVLIGAGAGLSSAAGLTYSGKRFRDNFSEFIEAYGIEDMYSATFYPYASQEEYWAYWARHIDLNRYQPVALPLYQQLYEVIKGKDTFVITTNVDGQFEKAGFPKERLFEVQGNYGYLQCATGCYAGIYPNEAWIKAMVQQTRHCRIPTELIPKCPVCGGNMDVHVRKNNAFVEEETWQCAYEAYQIWMKEAMQKNLYLIELGVGFHTPSIIRFPFEHICIEHPQASLLRINKEEAGATLPLKDQLLSFQEDIERVLSAIREKRE